MPYQFTASREPPKTSTSYQSGPRERASRIQAFAKFGAPVEGISAQDLMEPGSFFRMGTPPVMVDILPTIRGVDFDEAWKRRVDVVVSDNFAVPVISREDLLSSKRAAARTQDLADVEMLEKSCGQHELTQSPTLTSRVFEAIDELQRKGVEKWLERSKSAEHPDHPSNLTPKHERTQEYTPDDDVG